MAPFSYLHRLLAILSHLILARVIFRYQSLQAIPWACMASSQAHAKELHFPTSQPELVAFLDSSEMALSLLASWQLTGLGKLDVELASSVDSMLAMRNIASATGSWPSIFEHLGHTSSGNKGSFAKTHQEDLQAFLFPCHPSFRIVDLTSSFADIA